jgi:hypothetical protein
MPMICSSVRIVRFIVRPFLGEDSSRWWRKNPVAGQQAYITAAKTKALEAGTCGCLFDGFSFDNFTSEVLGKSAADLINDDRRDLEAYLTQHQRETEAHYRDLETICRSM